MENPLKDTALDVVDVQYGFAFVKDASNPHVLHVMATEVAAQQLQANVLQEAQQAQQLYGNAVVGFVSYEELTTGWETPVRQRKDK